MPGTLPNSKFAEVTVNSVFSGTTVTMDSGKIQRLNWDGHHYSFNVRYPSLTYDAAKAVSGFIAQQRGPLNNFTMSVPEISIPSGAAKSVMERIDVDYPGDRTTALGLNGVTGVNIANNTIYYTLLLPSPTYYDASTHGDWFNIGDYVNFSNHTKTYQTVSSVNPTYTGTSFASGVYDGTAYVYEGNITVSPNLVVTDTAQWVTTGPAELRTYMMFDDVKFTVFMVDPQVSYVASVGNNTSMSLNVREET